MTESQDQQSSASSTDMQEPHTRCGFVAVVGRPNVGKSTLTNALAGSKVSIVSRKHQTTRHRIHAVLTQGDHQFVFVDTPGFQTRHQSTLNSMMNRVVTQTLGQVDVILHLVEANKWSAGDEQILPLLPANSKCILVISKIDEVKDKNSLFAFVQGIVQKYPYEAVVPISALKGIQTDVLLSEIAKYLPASEFMFEADALTDRPVRFLAAELIREKIFRLVGDELPYACTVVIEKWQQLDQGVHINACVIVEKEGHRPILLGAGGQHMKRIATEARQDIKELLDQPVFLEIYIKVRKGWADKVSLLKELGYE